MAITSVLDADVTGKRVLVRVDFNVPIDAGVVGDDTRIRASLPTIESILERSGSVILVSHLGRPKGKVDDALRLTPVAARLAELLDRPVQAVDDVTGPNARAAAASLRPGGVLLLENVRFDPREEQNDPTLSEELADLAEIYVNDAFGAAHRAHASTTGVAAFLPSYIGLLMLEELKQLGALTANPDRPFVAVLGGAKVTDKVGVIQELLGRVDALLLGGGMANTFAMAQGQEIGDSLADRDFVDEARSILTNAEERGVKVQLPVDVVVAADLDADGTLKKAGDVGQGDRIFDIGPETVQEYATVINEAGTVFWNGPMGVFERPTFAEGTIGIARAIAASKAFSVVGGGDSLAAIDVAGVGDQIDHLSTGGGASLEFLEGKTLPGVAALERE